MRGHGGNPRLGVDQARIEQVELDRARVRRNLPGIARRKFAARSHDPAFKRRTKEILAGLVDVAGTEAVNGWAFNWEKVWEFE